MYAQLEGITRGLLYLHERDIVHGDLKPVSTLKNYAFSFY